MCMSVYIEEENFITATAEKKINFSQGRGSLTLYKLNQYDITRVNWKYFTDNF